MCAGKQIIPKKEKLMLLNDLKFVSGKEETKIYWIYCLFYSMSRNRYQWIVGIESGGYDVTGWCVKI